MRIIATIICFLIISNCSFAENTINYSEIPAYSDLDMLQMVIEIPAGTNKKLEYNYETNSFMIDKINPSMKIPFVVLKITKLIFR